MRISHACSIALLLFGLGVSPIRASEKAPTAEAPILEVFQRGHYGPRGTINWSDSHAFALFADGKVIWRDNWEERLEAYNVAKIKDVQRYKEYGAALCKLGAGGPVRASNWSDGPSTVVKFQGQEVEFYGAWDVPPKLEQREGGVSAIENEAFEKDLAVWKKFPEDARRILRELKNFNPDAKERWVPTIRVKGS